MQREFVANVSHELRTPVTTVKSYVETILEGNIREEETLIPFLTVINKESDRMTSLITELLELSRIDSRQVRLRMEDVNLTELLSDCVRRYRIHADKKEQTMEMRANGPAVNVKCDRARIEQVIRNLLMNAVVYSPPGASITVWSSLDPEKGEGALHIADTGMGIAYKEQKRILNDFTEWIKPGPVHLAGPGWGWQLRKKLWKCTRDGLNWTASLGKAAPSI